MIRVTLAGLRAHKLRLLMTALAIALGVGFVAGTLIFGDTAKAALYDSFAHSARNVDVAVQPNKAAEKRADSGPTPRIPASTLDRVRAVPGVAAADGRMADTLPMLDRHGRMVANGGQPGVGENVTGHASMREYTVASGRLPSATGEAALDADTAARTGYHAGDTITVLGPDGTRHPVRLVGTVDYGKATANAGLSQVLLTSSDLAAYTGRAGFKQIVVSAAHGTSPDALTSRVRTAVGGAARVQSGDALRKDLAKEQVGQLDILLDAILLFGVIALVVSAFVIYNTFTILIAQRTRELALLRCVGASRAQVFGSVLIESLVLGVVASVAGLGLGALLATGANAVAGGTGGAVPAGVLTLTGSTVLIALLSGVLVTVASATIPAFAAGRVAPMAALRINPAAGVATARRKVVRFVLAALIATIGGAFTFLGVRGAGDTANGANLTGMVLVTAGGMVVFLAVVVLSPLFLGWLTAAVGWLPGKLFGTPARLAAANARRNPGRVAATTTALMLGVALMSIFSVMLSSVKVSAAEQMARSMPADYILSGTFSTTGTSSVPDAAVAAVRARHEFSGVVPQRSHDGTAAGRPGRVSARPDGATAARPAVTSGSLSDLRPGTVALDDRTAKTSHHKVGDTIGVGVGGTTRQARLVAVYRAGGMLDGALLPWSDYTALVGAGPADMVMVDAAHGVDPKKSRAALDAALAGYPLVQVSSMAELRSQMSGSVDQMLGIVAGLLGCALVIALFGIANTMSLSVHERTRESAMLRALGLTRGQLRGTLLVEALLMGLVGALIGVVFGVGFGWAGLTAALGGLATVQVPVGQLALFLALAAAAGALAAVLPARRAARASIVSAMADA